MSAGRILIVEDEKHLAEGIQLNLENAGYETEVALDGKNADELLALQKYDLIVLDVMLPGMDGFEICRRLRARDNRTPVIFLTARKNPEDRVTGLDLGGDDYLQKPFHIKELLSRVHAILRRRAWFSADSDVREITFGNNTVNFATMEGRGPRGKVTLGKRETLILKLLSEREGESVSRSEILDRAWGANQYPTDRTVDNFIVKLRQHFEEDPGNPKYILTVRGVGYRLIKDL